MSEREILQMFLINEGFKNIIEKEIEIKEIKKEKPKTLKDLIVEKNPLELEKFFYLLYDKVYNFIYIPIYLKHLYAKIGLLKFLLKKAEDEDFYYKLRSFNVGDVFFPFNNNIKFNQEQSLLTNIAFDNAMFKMIILNEGKFVIKIDNFWYYNLIFQILKAPVEALGYFVENLIEFDYFVNSCCYQVLPFRINFAIFDGDLYRINKEKRNYSFIVEFKLDSYGKISETRLFALEKISNKLITEGSCHPNAWGSTKFCWGNVTQPGYITKDFMFSMVSSINFDSPATKMEDILPEFRDFYEKIVEKILKQRK
jgi:hypothetical protein